MGGILDNRKVIPRILDFGQYTFVHLCLTVKMGQKI